MQLHTRLLNTLLLSAFALTSLSGCGLLFGNVKPVAEKAENYGVMDLAQANPEWIKLDPAQGAEAAADKNDDGVESSGFSDVAYQSRKTASIISLNSTCRKSHETQSQDLRDFTNLLFLGISDITLREEKQLNIQGSPALQTTIRGKLNREKMMLRTVIVRRAACVYDLMYVARPETFSVNEPDFSRFIASLRLK